MVTYVVVGVVTVVLLALSFRALATPTVPVDATASLRHLLAAVAPHVGALEEGLTRPGDAEQLRRLVAAARPTIVGCRQRVTALDVVGADEAVAAARDLVAVASEECGWACRLVEAEGFAVSDGMRRAALELVGDARRCLDAAAHLMGSN